MSLPWHVNLISGLRFFHLAVMVAPWRQAGQEGEDVPARAMPVRFESSPVVKKQGKKAIPEQIASYRKALKARVGAVQARREFQGYVDRWQIEVAHCELKDGFGIQDSQVQVPVVIS